MSKAITWEGAEALEKYLVPVEDLKDTEGNPDKGEKHVAELMGSLRRFGQTRPILTDLEDSVTIRAGHHLRRAARELGWSHIAAMPSRFASYEEALAYSLADNVLTEIGQRDQQAQMNLIDLIGEGNLEGTGMSIDDAENLRALLLAVPEVPQVEPWEGGYSETPEEAAARAAAIGQQEPHKEVVLLLTLTEYEQFGEHIRFLQKRWSISGIKDTFLGAVKLAVLTADTVPEGELGELEAEVIPVSSAGDVSNVTNENEEVTSPVDPDAQIALDDLVAEVEDPDEPGFLA